MAPEARLSGRWVVEADHIGVMTLAAEARAADEVGAAATVRAAGIREPLQVAGSASPSGGSIWTRPKNSVV